MTVYFEHTKGGRGIRSRIIRYKTGLPRISLFKEDPKRKQGANIKKTLSGPKVISYWTQILEK